MMLILNKWLSGVPKRQIIAWCPGNTLFLEPVYGNEGKLLLGADCAKKSV
jgi:hypothetical protein